MMQYIEIYDSRFQSEPKNGRNNQDLDSLINLGNSINAKVNALVSKSKNENFTKALNDLSASVNANTQAVREGADNYDFEDYTKRSYKVLNRATQLVSEKKLDQATADLMTQLYGNLDIIKTNPAISTADKRGAARAISRIMNFYNDNLFDPKKRSELRSTEQLSSLSKNVNALITENKTALEAVRQKDPQAAQIISANIEKTNTDLFDDMRTLTTMVQANNWADWETRKIQMEQEAIQEHAEQEQQMREEHGFKTVEQQKLQEVVDRSPEQYKNVPFLNGVMDILGIDEKQFPEGEFEYPATNGNMVKRDLRKELATLKTNAINAVTQTANFFAPAHENSHYMTLDEIRQTNDVNYDLTRQCSRFVSSLKLAGRPQAE